MDVNRDNFLLSDNAINAVIDERYQLLELVGRGGSGVVYKAMDLNLQREVAVKILSAECFNEPGQFERFERESQILRQLRAINTVFFYDCGKTNDGLPYIVMEFVVGNQLKNLLESQFNLPPERVVSILTQVFSSLQEAHAIGFVHRDLKPANIMLVDRVGNDSDFVKVLDFGVAKVVDDSSEDLKNELVGTPKYMAPEQFRGEEVTPSSDLYSMGCVAFEMLTGISPFDGETLHVTIAKHLFMDPPPFPDTIKIYPNLIATVLRLLQKQPQDRFASAADVNEALAHWQEPVLIESLAQFTPSAADNSLSDLFNGNDEGETVPISAPSPQIIAAAIAERKRLQEAANNPSPQHSGSTQPPASFADKVLACKIKDQTLEDIFSKYFIPIVIGVGALFIILILVLILICI